MAACRCSAVLHLLLCVVKRQLIVCFKSSKPIQIGLCVLMSLSIHLHGLHLDAQCGQTYLSTQYAVERGLVVGFCGQPYYCYRPYYPRARFRSPSLYIWSLMNSSRTGLWTFRSHALSFPGTKRPHSECSFPGTNVWTFRSRNETAYSNFRALERLREPNEEKE